jgi:hypothetical protein
MGLQVLLHVSISFTNHKANNFFRDEISIVLSSETVVTSSTELPDSRCILLKSSSKEVVNNPLVEASLNKQTKFDSNLIIHYTYEKRLQNNKKDINEL